MPDAAARRPWSTATAGAVETWELVGDTPLVRLRRLESVRAASPRLLAKLEAAHLGAAKDRPAQRMLDKAGADGVIGPGSTNRRVELRATSAWLWPGSRVRAGCGSCV